MGIRTPGLLIANETLYQLSYTPEGLALWGLASQRIGQFGPSASGTFPWRITTIAAKKSSASQNRNTKKLRVLTVPAQRGGHAHPMRAVQSVRKSRIDPVSLLPLTHMVRSLL